MKINCNVNGMYAQSLGGKTYLVLQSNDFLGHEELHIIGNSTIIQPKSMICRDDDGDISEKWVEVTFEASKIEEVDEILFITIK
jgi:hypothetical protein